MSMKKKPLQILAILHWSMAMPMVVFGGITYYVNWTAPVGALEESNQLLLYTPAAVLLVAFPASGMLYSRMIGMVGRDDQLPSKLARFQTAHIIRMASFEAAGLLGGVMSLITATSYNLIIIAVALGMFILNQPSAEKVSTALKLDSKETGQLKGA